MRTLALALGLGLLAGACGSGDAGRRAETELEITVWPEGRGSDASTTVELTCDPPGGTHPAPAAACAALAANEDALEPVPPERVCTQIFGGPQEARVVGRYRGREVTASFSRTNGCEIGRWDALAPLLGAGAT